MKGGQSVVCQGQIFGNAGCRLENESVECRLFRTFEGKMSSVWLILSVGVEKILA